MISEIRAPKTGLTAEKITITTWHKKVGDLIKNDALLLTIETEKTTLDITATRSGYLLKIIVQEGETVPISEVIGLMADSMDEPVKMTKEKKIIVSPVARTMAREHGIDQSTIQGTGPGGRIQKADVLMLLKEKGGQIIEPEKKEKPPEIRPVRERKKVTPVRRIIAQKTLESKRTIPHYYLFSSFDVTDMLLKRKEFLQTEGLKLSIDAIMIKASALCITKHPLMNAHWSADEISLYEEVRIGFAVDTDEGIIIPHLTDPQKKSIRDIENAVQELVERALKIRVPPQDLESGSLSISNLGMYSIDEFIPIIYPGEVSMLGIGRAVKTARWTQNGFVPRDIMKVVLSLDHRIMDGGAAARFLEDLKQIIEGDGIDKILQ
jgi:pyruvate dehydrogenase E2 component (dihydrolipoamide acetyltransferase)